MTDLPHDLAELEELTARHLSPGKVAFYKQLGLDLVMGERRGVSFQDAFGPGEWINCHVNGGVFNLGHGNPVVRRAVVECLESGDIGNHHLLSPWRARLAARLSRTTEDRLPGVVFGVSGGEAIDTALKIARGVTGRTRIVSAVGGYHGHTGLAYRTGDPEYRDMFGPASPEFVQVPFDDLEAMNQAVDERTAAVILEPIPATLGMPVPSPDYFAGVRARCDETGARLIVDEVQTGLGRTGRMWAHQHEGIVPDALVTGKGLGGGIYPITATLLTREMHALLDTHPFAHISTAGGAEPGCAAALTVLDLVEAPGFLDHVDALSRRLVAGLAGLPFEHRHRGLMMGLKFEGPDSAIPMAAGFIRRGVFTVFAGNDTSVLQFLPPLVMTDSECDGLIARVRSVFS